MSKSKIQQIFDYGWSDYCNSFQPSPVQAKAAHAIRKCKSAMLGCNVSICDDCGYTDFHNNSCRNRNCPNCQAVLKELWIDKRKSEVIDTPYFHVVFTVPSELNALIYSNQERLYSLLHRCSAETLLELSANKKYLGATPGIIQVLHTWGQQLNFHPHIHCIVTKSLNPVGMAFLSRRRCWQKNFAESSWPAWMLFTSLSAFPFLPVQNSEILMNGRN